MDYQLGLKAKDTITGFTGILTAHVDYITGCDQYLLAPPVDSDGKHVEALYFDSSRLIIIDNAPPIKLNRTEEAPGACESAPIK